MSLPVLVINRAVDQDRLETFIASASTQSIRPTRIDAYDVHRPDFPFGLFAELIGSNFWGEDQIKPGAIGCFLSHRRAWQWMLDTNAESALICEDDIELTESLNRLVSVASAIPGLDILFANDRLGAWAETAFPAIPHAALGDVIDMLSRIGGPKQAGVKSSPGGDCYLLTQNGAERLLAMTKEQRIVCGVDWAMVWNGLTGVDSEAAKAFPELRILNDIMAPPDLALNVHVLTSPVSRQVPGPSSLKHSETRSIKDLVDRKPSLAHTEYVSTISVGGTQLCFAGRSGPDPVMEAHRSGDLWDEAGIRLLLERFPTGGTFVDIGAHLGNHSVAIGKLGAAGRVLAIDANPEIHKILHANIAMNGLSNQVEVAQPGLALGASEGEAWLLLNRRRSSETMVKKDAPEDDASKSRVRTIMGDEWLADQKIDAIKIDTAGTEVDVLRGLRTTIQTQKPVILIDHSENSFERIQRLAGELSMQAASTVESGRKRRSSTLLLPTSNAGR